MRVITFFEYVAAVLIIVGIIGKLGQLVVCEAVYYTAYPPCSTIVVPAPSAEEKAMYLAEMQRRSDMDSRRSVRIMEAKARAGL